MGKRAGPRRAAALKYTATFFLGFFISAIGHSQLSPGAHGELPPPAAASSSTPSPRSTSLHSTRSFSLTNGTCPQQYQYLYFLHIQKTAGSYLRDTALKWLVHKGDVVWCPRRALPDALYRNCLHNPEYADESQHIAAAMRHLFPAVCSSFTTHQDYGLYGAVLDDAQRAHTVLLTALREPVGRVVSEYYFYMRYYDLHIPIRTPNIRTEKDFKGLLTYAKLSSRRNLMTRLLAGVTECDWRDAAGQLSPTLGKALFPKGHKLGPEDLLHAAKVHLGEFCWVGIGEQMKESHALLQLAVGRNDIPYSSRKRNSNSHADPPPDVLKKIAEYNSLDVQLYEYAVEMLKQRYQAAVEQGLVKKH